MSIVVTGATGHLGRHVVEQLLEKVPAEQITAVVRTAEKAADFAAARREDRASPTTTAPRPSTGVFAAGDKVLLISGNEFDKGRAAQHQVVIDAAKAAGRRAPRVHQRPGQPDRRARGRPPGHRGGPPRLRLPYSLLRNGWYNENYTEHLAPVLEHSAVVAGRR